MPLDCFKPTVKACKQEYIKRWSDFRRIYAGLQAWAVLYSQGWSSTLLQSYQGGHVCQELNVNDILSSWVVPGTFVIICLQILIGMNHVTQNWFGNTFSSWQSWECQVLFGGLKTTPSLKPNMTCKVTDQPRQTKRYYGQSGRFPPPQLIGFQNI